MAIQPTWISSFGANSKRVTYPAGATLADVMDTVESVITELGWTLYDVAAGTDARVYRSICHDGVRYKYIKIDFNTATRIYLTVYETWNTVTHTGTNPTGGSDSNWAQYPALAAGGNISIGSHGRYCIIKGSDAITWVACFEIYPFNDSDTPGAGYPVSVFTYSGGMASTTPFSLTRTRAGQTGADATQTSLLSIWGKWGHRYYANTVGGTDLSSNVIPGTLLDANAGPDASDAIVLVTSSTSTVRNEIKGRIFNLIIKSPRQSSSIEAFVDNATVLADANGWPDRAGTLTDYWLWHSNSNVVIGLPK